MKRIKRLLILQHLEIEGPGLFEHFAKEKDLEIEVVRLDKKDNLPKTKEGDLILIMVDRWESKILGAKNTHGLSWREIL